MNLKKKLRGSLSLARKSDGGFTLVELIVVIAILAILAGVAVPAYSGYVEKANTAADEQLLAALNTAFASACNINGENNYNRGDNPSITIGTDGAVAIDALTTGSEKVNNSFETFFEGGTFKVMTELYYNGQLGAFKDMAGNIFNQIFSGLDLTSEQAKLAASIFGIIGAEELMEKIDVVTDLVANGGDAFAAMLVGQNGANLEAMAKAMGYEGVNDADFHSAYDAMIEAKVAGGMTEDEATNYILANYAVLQAAKTTTSSGKTTADYLSALQNGNYVEMTKNLMNQDDAGAQQEGMSQAAMMYAMYTAYANGLEEGEAKTAALENVQDISKFVNAVGSDTGFNEYLEDTNGQATKDLEGYLASMSVIDKSVANNGDAVSDLLENGYANAELIAGLNGLLGG